MQSYIIRNQYNAKTIKLTYQLRMNANPETMRWIDHFVAKELLPLPPDSKFVLKIFEEASAFKEAIKSNNDKVGLSRIVSTFDYLHKKIRRPTS
ncbi:DNA/RNA helicase domain-containing protein [Rossellomorea sp. NS-SX7]|uniref:DNA/RNA helicase domain-containing protein n=1 Tax=Rossellomorea sp. NS-SX7 TaxID=3463856 RepID=UPI00405A0078